MLIGTFVNVMLYCVTQTVDQICGSLYYIVSSTQLVFVTLKVPHHIHSQIFIF